MFHDVIVEVSLLCLMSFELPLESYNVLSDIAHVSKLGDGGGVVDGFVDSINGLVVEKDVPQLESRWWKVSVVGRGKGGDG